jgi:hypothetical protein
MLGMKKICIIFFVFCSEVLAGGEDLNTTIQNLVRSMNFIPTTYATFRINHWEDSLFATKSISSVSFKSRKPMNGNKKYYIRLSIETYTYDDTLKAAYRLAHINTKPPFLLPEEVKTWPLRRCLRYQNNVMVLKTDAVLFEEPLDSVYKTFLSRFNPDSAAGRH